MLNQWDSSQATGEGEAQLLENRCATSSSARSFFILSVQGRSALDEDVKNVKGGEVNVLHCLSERVEVRK